MRRSRRRGLAKERFLMVASAILVLGSLTATGLWLGRDTGSQDEGYVVDLSSIENNAAAGAKTVGENEMSLTENVTQDTTLSDDLDYDPYFQETNSLNVENPDQSDSKSMSDGAQQEDSAKAKKPEEQDSENQEVEEQKEQEVTCLLYTSPSPRD